MSASRSQSVKQTPTTTTTTSATQNIADSFNSTLSLVTNSMPASTDTGSSKLLLYGGLGLAGIIVLAFALNK